MLLICAFVFAWTHNAGFFRDVVHTIQKLHPSVKRKWKKMIHMNHCCKVNYNSLHEHRWLRFVFNKAWTMVWQFHSYLKAFRNVAVNIRLAKRLLIKWASFWVNRSSEFPSKSDTNRAVQRRRKARGLKLGIYEIEGMECTICVAKTKALISFAVTAKLICVFVFAYAKIRFSHVAAHFSHCIEMILRFLDRSL